MLSPATLSDGPIVLDSDLLHLTPINTPSSFVSSSTDVVSSAIPSSAAIFALAVNSPSIDIFSNSIQPSPGVVSVVPPTIDIFFLTLSTQFLATLWS